DASLTVLIQGTAPVRHQAAGSGKITIGTNRWYFAVQHQSGEVLASIAQVRITSDYDPTGSRLDQTFEDTVQVAVGARIENMELQPEGAGRSLRVFRLDLRIRVGWVDEYGNGIGLGHHLAQQLQPFRPDLHVQRRHAGDVASWLVQARDKPQRDRI